MNKIINPCICNCYNGRATGARGYVKITYEDEKLKLYGVIGPMYGGNAKGSCGQCTDEFRKGTPTEKWNQEMLDKLCDIWEQWHLNDLRPYCKHQKDLGWDKLAKQQVTWYHYKLTKEALNKKKQAEDAALSALREGKTFTPTEEQTVYATMPYSFETYKELSGIAAASYEPDKSYPIETKALGWLYPKDHPDGILTKPCPVCGYKYGSSWKKEKVPQEIIDWLFALPNPEVIPAWI